MRQVGCVERLYLFLFGHRGDGSGSSYIVVVVVVFVVVDGACAFVDHFFYSSSSSSILIVCVVVLISKRRRWLASKRLHVSISASAFSSRLAKFRSGDDDDEEVVDRYLRSISILVELYTLNMARSENYLDFFFSVIFNKL